jgi:hypothetical protein
MYYNRCPICGEKHCLHTWVEMLDYVEKLREDLKRKVMEENIRKFKKAFDETMKKTAEEV